MHTPGSDGSELAYLQILNKQDEGSIRAQRKACLGLLHIKALQVDVCQGDMEGAKHWDCRIWAN